VADVARGLKDHVQHDLLQVVEPADAKEVGRQVGAASSGAAAMISPARSICRR
jgi:hypothetical protein